jgi:hypothetical protein
LGEGGASGLADDGPFPPGAGESFEERGLWDSRWIEETALLWTFFIEQAAVLGRFQLCGSRRQTGFDLCGELVVEQAVFALLRVYLGLPFGSGIE